MKQTNDIVKVMTGVGLEEVNYSDGMRDSFRVNQVGIGGLSEGVITVKARGRGTDLFVDFDGGVLNLATNQTFTIVSDSLIEALQFTTTPNAAFTVSLFQSDHRADS